MDLDHNGSRWGAAGGPPERVFRPVAQVQDSRPERPPRLWLHVLLFLATAATTTLAGGFLFSVTFLAILGIHEFGHYFASRRWGVKATLPYFIPAPVAFGTMGAVIKIRSPIPNRNALVDIGAAGPIAGFVTAIFALCVGLSLSEIKPTETAGSGLFLGDSLLSSWLARLIVGEPGPGTDIFLHPVAFAGWLGLFITVLNLLPIGQLDGGHIVYALFERQHALIANAATAGLLLLTLAGPPYTWMNALHAPGFHAAFVLKVWLMERWYGWLFFVLVIRGVLGVRHPPLIEVGCPLGPGRKAAGYASLAIFVICFIPVPFSGL